MDPRDQKGNIIYDRGVNLLETWRAMESLADQGKCRAIGLSDVVLENLVPLYEAARIKPAVVQVESHPYLPQTELLEFCKEKGIVFLAFAPFVGVHMNLVQFSLVIVTVFLVSFALTALGFAIAWPMDSNQAFHAIINLFLIPLWLLSGALFPMTGASGWIRWLMLANPLTYGVEALRQLLFPGTPGVASLSASLATLLLFSLFMFGLAFLMANRRTTKPAA